MLKKIVVIAWKNIRLRFMTPTELLFFLVLPILFSFLIGGGLAAEEAESRVTLLVVDQDGSELAQDLVEALGETGIVTVHVSPQGEAEASFEDEKAPALLTIPAGFADALRAGEAVALHLHKGPSEEDADLAEQAVAGALSTMSRSLAVATASVAAVEARQPFEGQKEREAAFAQNLAMAKAMFSEAPERVKVTLPEAMGQGEDTEDSFDLAAHHNSGQMITWVFIPLLGISAAFAYERTQGTLRRLLITPTSKATFLLGTISGEVVVSLVQMAILLTFGSLVMGVNWASSVVALVVLLVAFSLASVAIGTFMATFVKTGSQAANLSIAAGMVMALLGGCWYPAEMFPAAVRTATKILPTAWAMQGLTDLSMRGQGLVGILPEAGVLAGFAVVFFLLGLWRFKYE
jgi:ABC-2 type transport system permease protein